jgi:hypothetical protein
MRATIKNSMMQPGMKKIVVFVCGFLVTSMTIAACSDLTGPTSPETPINVTTTLASPTSVRVDWTKSPQSDGVVSYNILRNGAKVGESTTFSYTDTGLAEKTTYKYTVSANCTSGLLSEASAQTAAATVTTGDVTPPRFVLISPVQGQTNVSTFATVTATFDEAMDPTTINTTTFSLKVSSGGANIPGTVTYTAATRLAEFKPTNQLPSATSITVTITAGVKDISGNALLLTTGSPGIWSFTTADQTPPTVVSTIPTDGATNVAINTTVTATFSEAMDATTISGTTFTLKTTVGGTAVTGTVTYDVPSKTATFTPSSSLSSNSGYTATITTGVKDLAGNAMAANKVFVFTVDNIPPTVLSVSPAPGAAGVLVTSPVNITFSEAMDAATITAAGNITVKTTATSTNVTGTVTYNAATNVATFTPTGSLAFGTNYTVTVTTGVKDLAGNAMASPFTPTFTTAAAPDTTPPTVLSVSPVNAATSVAVTSPVNITFSEAMDAATITAAGNITVKTTATLTPVTGTVTYNAATNVATFTPTGSLAFGTSYTVTVTTGVKDLAGNAMASPFTPTFTTVAAPDITPPTVISTVPTNSATNVAINTTVTATFSEAMDATTISGTTFTLKTTVGGIAVTGTVTYDVPSKTATFTLSSPLSNNIGYTATITTGVKDLAGNAMAAPKVVAFTTIADTTPPTVLSTSPANGTPGVLTTSVVTVTFSEAMDSASVATGGAFTLKATVAGTPVTGTVTYNTVTHVATFTPAGPLAAATTNYTATVTTAAKDVAGNPLSPGTLIFAFTTVP